MRVLKSDESGPSARRWCRGCSSGIIGEKHLVGSEFLSESGHTQPHVEYPSGKSLEAKLLKEQAENPRYTFVWQFRKMTSCFRQKEVYRATVNG